MKKTTAILTSILLISSILSGCSEEKTTDKKVGSDAETTTAVTEADITVSSPETTTDETTNDTAGSPNISAASVSAKVPTEVNEIIEQIYQNRQDEYSPDLYKAKYPNNIVESDAYAMVKLCYDMVREYYRKAYSQYKLPTRSFSDYTSNQNLVKYLNYTNEHTSVFNPNDFKFINTKLSGYPDYYYIETEMLSYSADSTDYINQGIVKFIVKNKDGKFEIADVYFDSALNVDDTLRKSFSIENNLDFWDNPDKYEPILQQIS
jgi:hypothetical protein